MSKTTISFLLAVMMTGPLAAGQLHVAVTGNDAHSGTRSAPLRTIQRAADLAMPGDVITVHAGVYRERINPPRGGSSDKQRIVYQAAKGELVEIKGSEAITNWQKVQEDVWKVTLPNSFFGDFNPYSDLIHGDWFDRRGRDHHTGAVYLNGDWLIEATKLEEVLAPSGTTPAWLAQTDVHPKAAALNAPLWFAQVNVSNTVIWAQFPSANPNEQLVEINVRQTVFYPSKPGRDFITVRGFTLRQAATPWAPPTAEQIGLIGAHWSKGWIIEDNVVSHSICSGISLGKYGDQYDNTSADSAEGYVKTIERAHAIGWSGETIGHHIVRNNTISDCEQAGVVGSLGAIYSTVTGNTIHDIHVRRLFSGAEMAGIKFHAAIDSRISNNHIYRTCRGIWLDWMAQGTRVSQNLFHDNASEDLFVEVDHGPFMVDNNLFLSPSSLLDMSEGGAYVHNLFAGKISNCPEPSRATPYHPEHGTDVAGLVSIKGGDDRFYNNIFVGNGEPAPESSKADLAKIRWISSYGIWGYDGREQPLRTGGNVYYRGAEPYIQELGPIVLTNADPKLKLLQQGGRFILEINPGPELEQAHTLPVSTKMLGEAKIPGLLYKNADDSALQINTDYFGRRRYNRKPTPGPFEAPGTRPLAIEVWQDRTH